MPGERRIVGLIAVGAILAVSAGQPVVPAYAQGSAGAEPSPSLPSGGDSPIRVRRDADGNLVPYEPDEPVAPTPAERAATMAMPNHLQAVQNALENLTPDRAERDFARARQQQIIDQVIYEERGRKQQGAAVDVDGLTARERSLVDQLAAIDRSVREHEMQHYYGGRPYSALPEYWTVRGPDGRDYAITGMVRFDQRLLPDDPEANIVKLQVLKRSALAPRDPSDEDRIVARELDKLIDSLRKTGD
ncbi:MAG: hypothetical protein CMM50_04075 [Rhodospirillaceae bacterium]|nr:hypothetical protein [Rhodospirillaceae bacterium]|tara:strand:- start:75 stop:812 length:738 start_codon:yes stop_codon:yes gene_type:complete